MSNEIKRKVELYFCEVLGAALPGIKFVPQKGGSNTDGEARIKPPFVVVEATQAEKVMATEPTWAAEATITYVTHIGDEGAPAHSAAVRQLYNTIEQLGGGFHSPQQLWVHGLDIAGTDDFTDDEKMSHGDVITVALGCTG